MASNERGMHPAIVIPDYVCRRPHFVGPLHITLAQGSLRLSTPLCERPLVELALPAAFVASNAATWEELIPDDAAYDALNRDPAWRAALGEIDVAHTWVFCREAPTVTDYLVLSEAAPESLAMAQRVADGALQLWRMSPGDSSTLEAVP
jgi:hypothetical protein